MRPIPVPIAALLLCVTLASAARAADPAIPLPAGVATHPDGRDAIDSLFRTYLELVERGWHAEVVVSSQPAGTTRALPVLALRSPKTGPAVWILAGIHGEEPAGPNAIAAAIDDIAALGEARPVVLLPLLNPQGYARNWRYLNVATYSETVDGQSVGDSSHLLPQPEAPGTPRAAAASSPEAGAITAYILRTSADYPPRVSIDLHEDNLIDQGYVYSQGVQGAADPLAIAAVGVLKEHGIALRMAGETRFGEAIAGGIVGPVVDGSIDELMSIGTVIGDGG
ncbi:MAG: hypothetical protein ACREVI_16190, partial [Steroidobacteraceae bacterium]